MRLSYKWIAIVAAMLLVGIAAAGVALAQTPLMITLNAQNNSGETGTAMLTDLGDGTTRVDVTVSGEPAGASQPMHLHTGTCANLNTAPAFPLNNLENGKSSTVITTTVQTLLASPYALNGHKSAAEISVYVFCGDILASAAQATTTVTSTGAAETPSAVATAAATEAATTAATSAATTEATTTATEIATTAATEAATTAATTAATETATTEATAAAGAATVEPTGTATEAATATTAAETPTAVATTTPLPTTGGDSPVSGLVPIAIAGLVLLVLGLSLYARRVAR